MTEPQIKNIFFISMTSLLFFVDLSLFSLLQQHSIFILECFIIILLKSKNQIKIVSYPFLLLCFISYLDNNIFGSCLIYMMPVVFIAKYFHKNIRIKIIIPYILIIIMMIIKLQYFRWMFTVHYNLSSLTAMLFYNIICLTIFIFLYNKYKFLLYKNS